MGVLFFEWIGGIPKTTLKTPFHLTRTKVLDIDIAETPQEILHTSVGNLQIYPPYEQCEFLN